MAETPKSKLQASIDAQKAQREAAIATSRKVSETIDEAAKEATESAAEK
jgi:hypothetical protein